MKWKLKALHYHMGLIDRAGQFHFLLYVYVLMCGMLCLQLIQ